MVLNVAKLPAVMTTFCADPHSNTARSGETCGHAYSEEGKVAVEEKDYGGSGGGRAPHAPVLVVKGDGIVVEEDGWRACG